MLSMGDHNISQQKKRDEMYVRHACPHGLQEERWVILFMSPHHPTTQPGTSDLTRKRSPSPVQVVGFQWCGYQVHAYP